jgi:hypothetical protein
MRRRLRPCAHELSPVVISVVWLARHGRSGWLHGLPGCLDVCLRLESLFAAQLLCAASFLLASFVVVAKPRRFTTHGGSHNLQRLLVTTHQTGQAVRMLEDHKTSHSGRNAQRECDDHPHVRLSATEFRCRSSSAGSRRRHHPSRHYRAGRHRTKQPVRLVDVILQPCRSQRLNQRTSSRATADLISTESAYKRQARQTL